MTADSIDRRLGIWPEVIVVDRAERSSVANILKSDTTLAETVIAGYI